VEFVVEAKLAISFPKASAKRFIDYEVVKI